MVAKPKLIGIRWSEDRFELSFYGLSTFVKYERPVIPGVEFDAFLYYEPTANKAEYTLHGMAYQMTDEQKKACDAYVKQIEIPGFTYDPLRYNIYMGVKTIKEAEAKGLSITYKAIVTEKSKFNETKEEWEPVFAMLCEEGRPFFEMTNSYDFVDSTEPNEDGRKPCSGDMQNAVMILTEEEWNVLGKNRTRDTDVYDFKTHQWVDNRSVSAESYRLQMTLSNYLTTVDSIFKYNVFQNLPSEVIEYITDPAFSMNESALMDIARDFDPDTEVNEYRDYIAQLKVNYNEYMVKKKETAIETIILTFIASRCSTVDEIDRAVDYINKKSEAVMKSLEHLVPQNTTEDTDNV
jgi:hypothetical protein